MERIRTWHDNKKRCFTMTGGIYRKPWTAVVCVCDFQYCFPDALCSVLFMSFFLLRNSYPCNIWWYYYHHRLLHSPTKSDILGFWDCHCFFLRRMKVCQSVSAKDLPNIEPRWHDGSVVTNVTSQQQGPAINSPVFSQLFAMSTSLCSTCHC